MNDNVISKADFGAMHSRKVAYPVKTGVKALSAHRYIQYGTFGDGLLSKIFHCCILRVNRSVFTDK